VSNSNWIIGGLVLILAVGLGWWIWSAHPSQVDIEAARSAQSPVPSPAFDTLDSQTFTSGTVPNGLPLAPADEGLGRDDPFAGL